MSDTAFQTQYRQEFVAGFEQAQSYLRTTATTEAQMKGNQAVFLVADSGGATPVTRGVNGKIPGRPDNLAQNTATLVEYHDKPQRTGFNIFASQGDGRRIMQLGTVKVMNRQIDQDILGELGNGTTTLSGNPTVTMSLAVVAKVKAKLGLNDVPLEEEDNLFFVISPGAEAYLMQVKSFTSADYVEVKPLVGPSRRYRRWAGFNWIVHPHVAGVGTSSETLFAYHRSAIGHAVNTGEMDVKAGYNDEDDYYWARSTMFMGSKLLQNKGVLKLTHDGSAYA